MKLLTSVFLFLLVDSAFPLEKIERKTSAAGGGRIPNSFIVQFKDVASSSSISSHFEWVDSLIGASSSQTLDGKKVGVVHKYGISAFKGYSGVFPTDIIEKIKKRSDVAVVEQDAIASTQTPVDIQPVSQQAPCISQILSQNELNGEWGLGRISHYHRYSATTNIGWPTYLYDEYIGKCPAGGTAYVLDSGVTTGHPEFTTGRATFGFKSNSMWPSHDVCGHGTHVAGIIGGNKYGVMKKAKLISVKVLEGSGGACSGPWSGIIAGINWAFNDAVANGRLKTSVMNLSLGGSFYSPVNQALAAAINGGFTAVVAAGNGYGSNSCSYTPASLPMAITVGSVNIYDKISPFSNLGCCIDIFAPGENIGSAYLNNQYALLSGTSMATPMVAGLVLYNKCRFGYSAPSQDLNGIMNPAYSINGLITPFLGCTSGNRMAYNRGNCL